MKKALVFLMALLIGATSWAYVDDALSFAYEAASPYVKKGFNVREDAWGGDLGVKDQQAVQAQLFKGNEYWFCLGTDVKGAVLSVSVYDSKGNIVNVETTRAGRLSAVRVEPQRTGTYYAIVTVHKSPQERTGWALVYAYK
ncbi:MAG: hypothetical protein CAK90_07065 [Spartobacteria bacterium AMD-G4]|jgi:hypothetical protein|nr:MAG: hypothetical protein CAK90_07065 [Spartobacteria bacterium AMD-G4]